MSEPQRQLSRQLSRHGALVRIALFAAIIAVLGMLPKFDLPFAAGVPVTAQTLGVMLAGLILGPRHGALAVMLFLIIVALGMPFLAGGRGGLAVFAGPAGGFLTGWIAGAAVCGFLMPRNERNFWQAFIAAITGGIAAIYAIGIPWLAIVSGIGLLNAALASIIFLPGDILKALAAALVATMPGVHRR